MNKDTLIPLGPWFHDSVTMATSNPGLCQEYGDSQGFVARFLRKLGVHLLPAVEIGKSMERENLGRAADTTHQQLPLGHPPPKRPGEHRIPRNGKESGREAAPAENVLASARPRPPAPHGRETHYQRWRLRHSPLSWAPGLPGRGHAVPPVQPQVRVGRGPASTQT